MTLKNAAILITFASIVQVLGYLYALPGHIGDPTWSHHAQFHLFLSWLWIVGLDIAIVAFAWGPLQKRERSSFWILLVLFISAQGGHFIASLVEPSGRPTGEWFDYALGLVALIYAVSLFIAWRVLADQKQA
jgi:NAD/NADP transhydrogenase beta subunit